MWCWIIPSHYRTMFRVQTKTEALGILLRLLKNLQAIILITTKLQREIMLLLANNVHEKHYRESRNFESVRVIRKLHSR